MPRGGKRRHAGAHRKNPDDKRVPLSFYVKPVTKDFMVEESRNTRTSMGRLLDGIIFEVIHLFAFLKKKNLIEEYCNPGAKNDSNRQVQGAIPPAPQHKNVP